MGGTAFGRLLMQAGLIKVQSGEHQRGNMIDLPCFLIDEEERLKKEGRIIVQLQVSCSGRCTRVPWFSYDVM